ncbi:MAG TPA: carboxypeptidase M32 [Planctomycetia bacterium]|nr:carboxypeptidase M32 [Planctomycetia bacterium]
MTATQAYSELVRRSREAALLGSAASLLAWDQETYMPKGGGEHRGEQLALMAGLVHQRRTDPVIGELLAVAEASELVADPESPESANVREWRRSYDRATKLPAKLVEELARTESLAQQAWVEAKPKSDFAAFAPWLEKMIGLKKAQAEAIGYQEHLYDALIDDYEPGAKVSELRPLFVRLRERLAPLVAKIGAASRKPDESMLRRDFPLEAQREFGSKTAAEFGFDFERGRLDVTSHPFCMGVGPGDCRLTTRYDAGYFNDGFFSILHEAGHGMYEQGLEAAHYGTPMGEAVSLGVHETQSRLWENRVGRSAAFWKGRFASAQGAFPSLKGAGRDAFHFAINAVAPTFIRVDADEATYNLHVILRFEIEQDLLTGALPVADVPTAWNAKMEELLGVTPPDDRRGCLQDVHWSAGLFGYFPTYALGNIGAAQLAAAADRDLGGLDATIEKGDFGALREWLRDRVHRHGMRYRPGDLLRRATGSALDPDLLLSQLEAKYGALYGI